MTPEEFEKNVLACEKTLYRVSMAILRNETDAEDAVSEAILTAFRRRETLREQEFFSTWLVRILINTCKKAICDRARRTGSGMPENFAAETPDEIERLAVEEALASLPERIRLAVVLHYMEGFPLEAVAKALKIPVGTVKSRLARGRELLRLELE